MEAMMSTILSKDDNMVYIPYHRLTLSDLNMRSHPDSELKETIIEHRLIHPLLVYPEDDGYKVFAGGRRLCAIDEIVKEGTYQQDEPIYCSIHTKERALELSLIENMKRKAVHPSLECASVVAMLKDNKTDNDIIKSLSITESKLAKYKRLGTLHKPIFNAWTKEVITTVQAMAYAGTSNKSLQKRVWNEHGSDVQTWAIKRSLLRDTMSSTDQIVRYVTVEAYAAAGGKYTEDLFAEELTLTNPELVTSLALHKLNTLADTFWKENPVWKWVDPVIEGLSYDAYHISLSGTRRILSDEEKEHHGVLSSMKAKLHRKAESTESIEDEELYEAVCGELDEFEDTLVVYTEFQMENSGVFIHLKHDGSVAYLKGVQKRSDVKQQNSSKKSDHAKNGSDSGAPVYTAILTQDVAIYKRNMVKAELLKHPDYAVDVLNHSIAINVFASFPDSTNDIRVTIDNTENSIEDFAGSDIEQFMADSKKGLNLKWLKSSNTMAAFIKLTPKDKKAIMVYCSAVTAHSMTNQVIDSLKTDMSDYWRPTATNYFNRLSRDQLLVDAAQLKVVVEDGSTKRVLVQLLHECFSTVGRLTNKQFERWMPAVFKQ